MASWAEGEGWGERGVTIVPAGHFLRMRYNPFHDYLEQRVLEFLAPLER